VPRPSGASSVRIEFVNREPQAAGIANLRSIAEEQNEACISAAFGKTSECSVQRLRVSFPSQDGMGPGEKRRCPTESARPGMSPQS
jgi:hypothetical protein